MKIKLGDKPHYCFLKVFDNDLFQVGFVVEVDTETMTYVAQVPKQRASGFDIQQGKVHSITFSMEHADIVSDQDIADMARAGIDIISVHSLPLGKAE